MIIILAEFSEQLAAVLGKIVFSTNIKCLTQVELPHLLLASAPVF